MCRRPIGNVLLICLIGSGWQIFGQSKAPAPPDELVFMDGEKLLGRIERSDGDSVTFKSRMAGEVTVAWSKVKELHSANQFAVVPKGVRFGRKRNTDAIPTGHLSFDNQSLEIAGGNTAERKIPVGEVGYVIDQPTFEKSLRRRSWYQDWKGTATVGVALVLATQNNRSYTSTVAFSRSIPNEAWISPENRTTLLFSSSYGELTQPGQPLTKTSIYHAEGERDEYISPRLFAFADLSFDHNFSQGLDLQRTLGGGLGWSFIRGPHEQFDLRAQLTFVSQEFLFGAGNQKLVGSVFSENYEHRFRRGVILQEALSISPGLSNTQAYSASGNVAVAFPITRHLSLALNSLDTFLNDPSPGFKKNSFQYTTGMTYNLP